MSLRIIVLKGNLVSADLLIKELANTELRQKYLRILEENRDNYSFMEGSNGEVVDVKKDIVIGREGNLAVPFQYPNISRKHCKLIKHVVSGWHAENLSSSGGTYLKRKNAIVKLIEGEFPLQNGDIIILDEPKIPMHIELQVEL